MYVVPSVHLTTLSVGTESEILGEVGKRALDESTFTALCRLAEANPSTNLLTISD